MAQPGGPLFTEASTSSVVVKGPMTVDPVPTLFTWTGAPPFTEYRMLATAPDPSAATFTSMENWPFAQSSDTVSEAVGAVHPIQTMELIYVLEYIKYDRPIYFDTFPDTTGMDPVAECSANIATVEAMRNAVRKLQADNRLKTAIAGQDAVTSNNVVREALYGGLTADTAKT